jgi:ubiquinone/menaquinone biosynthesis C-methylase UbiE
MVMIPWKQKQELMNRYNMFSASYDDQYSKEQNSKIKTALQHVNMHENSIVLDVGCGTGQLFKFIKNKTKLLIGLDISRQTLKKAKNHTKRSKITLILADADYMPFPNAIFDQIFAITLIQNSSSPLLTLREIMRVGKKNSNTIVTGLKKKFSKKTLLRLLRKSGFQDLRMVENKKLKGYVVICRHVPPSM